jgi:hypothetical protein
MSARIDFGTLDRLHAPRVETMKGVAVARDRSANAKSVGLSTGECAHMWTYQTQLTTLKIWDFSDLWALNVETCLVWARGANLTGLRQG